MVLNEAERPPEPPLWSRAFVALCAAQLAQSLAGASMHLFPLYLDALDCSRREIGVLLGLAALTGLIAQPWIARAMDRVGRPTVIHAGCWLSFAGFLAIWFADRPNVFLYMSRVLIGLGGGCLFTALFTWVGELVPPSRRVEGIAAFGIFGMVTVAVNPIADGLGFDGANLRFLYPVVGSMFLVSSGFIALAARLSAPREARVSKVATSLRGALAPALVPVLVATFCLSVMATIWASFAVVAAKSRGVAEPASVWWPYLVAAITVRVFGARLADRRGPRLILSVALGAYVVGMLLAAFGASPLHFGLAGALAGFSHGSAFPVVTGLIVDRTPEAQRSSAMGISTQVWYFSGIALPPLFGWIADTRSDAVMFATAAGVGLGSMAVWWWLESRAAVSGHAAQGR